MKMKLFVQLSALIALVAVLAGCKTATRQSCQPSARWTPEQAHTWQAKQP